jgi:hypothetical protein
MESRQKKGKGLPMAMTPSLAKHPRQMIRILIPEERRPKTVLMREIPRVARFKM